MILKNKSNNNNNSINSFNAPNTSPVTPLIFLYEKYLKINENIVVVMNIIIIIKNVCCISLLNINRNPVLISIKNNDEKIILLKETSPIIPLPAPFSLGYFDL